jgi:hypothetical protein
VGADIHNAAAIVPEWRHIDVGDEVRLGPEVPLTVALVEPKQALVLRGEIPMGRVPAPYDFTWAFVLRDAGRIQPASGAGTLPILPPLGRPDRAAGRGDQLRDEPANAARHQAPRGTALPNPGPAGLARLAGPPA